MSIAPGEDIGMETHKDVDQFVRVEAGIGQAILNGTEHGVHIPHSAIHKVLLDHGLSRVLRMLSGRTSCTSAA